MELPLKTREIGTRTSENQLWELSCRKLSEGESQMAGETPGVRAAV